MSNNPDDILKTNNKLEPRKLNPLGQEYKS